MRLPASLAWFVFTLAEKPPSACGGNLTVPA
jgi:hypothetical protein